MQIVGGASQSIEELKSPVNLYRVTYLSEQQIQELKGLAGQTYSEDIDPFDFMEKRQGKPMLLTLQGFVSFTTDLDFAVQFAFKDQFFGKETENKVTVIMSLRWKGRY